MKPSSPCTASPTPSWATTAPSAAASTTRSCASSAQAAPEKRSRPCAAPADSPLCPSPLNIDGRNHPRRRFCTRGASPQAPNRRTRFCLLRGDRRLRQPAYRRHGKRRHLRRLARSDRPLRGALRGEACTIGMRHASRISGKQMGRRAGVEPDCRCTRCSITTRISPPSWARTRSTKP